MKSSILKTNTRKFEEKSKLNCLNSKGVSNYKLDVFHCANYTTILEIKWKCKEHTKLPNDGVFTVQNYNLQIGLDIHKKSFQIGFDG